MTIWNGKLMRENELSGPAKVVLGIGAFAAIGAAMHAAARNAADGVVTRPWAFGLIAAGLVMILAPGLGLARRLGIALIVLGSLLTFG